MRTAEQPPSSGKDAYTRDRLQKIARLVDEELPDKWGFALFAFPLGEAGRLNYVAKGERKDIVETIKAWIQQTGGRFDGHQSDAAREDMVSMEAFDKWKNSRVDLLKEQIRVADIAYQSLFERSQGMVSKDELQPTIELLTRLDGHYFEPQIAHYRIVNEIARLKSLQGGRNNHDS